MRLSTETAAPRWRTPCLLAGLLAGLLTCRLWFLGADPHWSTEDAFITDEGFWVHNARNRVVLGRWVVDEFNQGLSTAPLYSLTTAGVFRLVGVGLRQARLGSAVCGALGVLVFHGLTRRAPRRAGVFATACLASSFIFLRYNLLAFPTAQMTLGLLLTAVFCMRRRRLDWLIGGACFACSVLTKHTAVLWMIVPAAAWMSRDGRDRTVGQIILFAVGFALATAAVWCALCGVPVGTSTTPVMLKRYQLPSSPTELAANLARFPPAGMLTRMPALAAGAAAYLLLAVHGWCAGAGRPRAHLPRVDVVMLAWAAAAFLATAPMNHAPERRYVLFVVPFAYFTGRIIARAWRPAPPTTPDQKASPTARPGGIVGMLVMVALPGKGIGRAFQLLLTRLLAWPAPPTAICETAFWAAGMVAAMLLVAAGRRVGTRGARRLRTIGPGVAAAATVGVAGVGLHGMASWALRRSESMRAAVASLAERTGKGDTVMGAAAPTLCLESDALAFTPRLGVFNRDALARYAPDLALVIKRRWGRALSPSEWLEPEEDVAAMVRGRPVVRRYRIGPLPPDGRRYRIEIDLYDMKDETSRSAASGHPLAAGRCGKGDPAARRRSPPLGRSETERGQCRSRRSSP